MARDLTSNTETASLAQHVRPVILIKIDASSGMLRVALTDRTITFDSADYVGGAGAVKISPINEPTDLSVPGVVVELSGLNTDYVDLAMNEAVQGRKITLYLGFLDASYALIADPLVLFAGRMDTMDIRLGATATISVRAESRLADWNRPRVRRYTHQDQIARFPSDKGLEFVAQTTEREIVWGRR